ncbi:MAG TPA: type II toxin-antitoxin system RelE/ParE family toxin [Pirellulales bacterium]|nr:type II toxin-antitoxin system RelE/ParE family toxin [Pirellulales bacterium]
MPAVLFLPEARDDLRDIWNYLIGNASVERADAVLDRVKAACDRYASHPELGEVRHDLAPDVRCFTTDSLVIFYAPTSDGIQIVRVIHGARNVAAQFRKHGR